MRATTLLRRLVGITRLIVESVRFDWTGVVLRVRPTWQLPRCGVCRRVSPRYGSQPIRRWGHLGFGRLRVWLEYAPRRVECASCGVRTEAVPWAEHGSRFTAAFEEFTAYLARATDKTTVRKLLGISWETVGRIVERVVARRQDPARLDDLRRIGIDEFSYRRRHRYLTVVVDHDRRRVVWSAPGSQYDTLKAFFKELGPERCNRIEFATIDMCAGYEKAIRENLPNAQVVFDRFHVQRLASSAVDEVRREQLRALRGTPEGKELFRSRFVLLKNPWDLDPNERAKLRHIERSNAPLFRAYLLKEMLARALDYKQPWRAERAIRDWLAWASRSRLPAFVRTARTIRRRLDGVLAYVRERLTNGVVEGMNNRFRMIARRAYGFHGPESLMAMISLACGGIQLDPPLPGPTRT